MENEVVTETQQAIKAEIEENKPEPSPEKPVKEQVSFTPKTDLGRRVLAGEIKDIDEVLSNNIKIMEEGVVDYLLPDLETDYLFIGQSKGKLGGGKRRIIRNTQKVTAEGKRQKFTAVAVVGDKHGHIGVGKGSGLESTVAKIKAAKTAKLNIIRIKMGCGSWECACRGSHSIPFKVNGRSGSVRVTLLPAPKGVGFAAADDIKTIMRLAGIKDIWSKVEGQTATRINLGYATFKALNSLNIYRYTDEEKRTIGIVD